MTNKIQIKTVSQAIELLKKAKQEYRELEKDRDYWKSIVQEANSKKMPFDKLFKSFK